MTQPLFDVDDDPADPTFGVRELADAVNQVLRRGFRDGVWVRGEIQGLQQRNGHVYFNLTEQGDDGQATMSVTLFANTWYRLRGVLTRHRLRLSNGLTVRVHGSLNFYAPSGRLSLLMDGLDVRFTLGLLAAQRDDLLARLEARGLMGRNAALPMPLVPLRLGLVTSRGSAAWHDVVHELTASRIGFRVAAADVRVQGADAPNEIAAGLRAVGRAGVDVALLVRGGGSRSDLAPFDSEPVALAVATAPVPVLTGLGHEIDRSVADAVAHTTCTTPTACAVTVVERVRSFLARTDEAWHAVARHASNALQAEDRRLRSHAHGTAARTTAAVQLARHRADQASAQLARRPAAVLRDADRSLDGVEARVRALDPAGVLARGWSITRRADGSLVRKAADVAAGDTIVTTLAEGTITSRVEADGS